MRKFLKKRLLGLPVAVLLILALTAGVAATGYAFLSFTTTVYVDEPLLVEYNLWGQYGGDSNWRSLGVDPESLTVWGSAGDTFEIDLRINNRANNPLTVTTEVTGDIQWFDITGLPDGSVLASDGNDGVPEWTGTMILKIKGNTPPSMNVVGEGGYTVTLTFKRS